MEYDLKQLELRKAKVDEILISFEQHSPTLANENLEEYWHHFPLITLSTPHQINPLVPLKQVAEDALKVLKFRP